MTGNRRHPGLTARQEARKMERLCLVVLRAESPKFSWASLYMELRGSAPRLLSARPGQHTRTTVRTGAFVEWFHWSLHLIRETGPHALSRQRWRGGGRSLPSSWNLSSACA